MEGGPRSTAPPSASCLPLAVRTHRTPAMGRRAMRRAASCLPVPCVFPKARLSRGWVAAVVVWSFSADTFTFSMSARASKLAVAHLAHVAVVSVVLRRPSIRLHEVELLKKGRCVCVCGWVVGGVFGTGRDCSGPVRASWDWSTRARPRISRVSQGRTTNLPHTAPLARPHALTCSTPPGLVPLTSTHAALLSLSFPFPPSSSASSLPTRSIFADAYCRTWSRILMLYASGSRISRAAASPFRGSVGLGYLSKWGRNCSKMFTRSVDRGGGGL